MKSLLLLVSLCFSTFICGQNTYKGSIIDSTTNEALPYVNIGVVGQTFGTVTDTNGNFTLTLPDSINQKTIRVSMIGYQSINTSVIEFKKMIANNPTILLPPKTTVLQPIVIKGKDMKEKVIGNDYHTKMVTVGFDTNLLGNEIGALIKIKKSPTIIKSFQTNVVTNQCGTMKFRMNIYDKKDGLPDKNLLPTPIYVTSTITEGLLFIDLSEYQIVVYDDFFITLEWIEDLGLEDLKFSGGFLGSAIIARNTSQDKWYKFSGVSIGFSVTARY